MKKRLFAMLLAVVMVLPVLSAVGKIESKADGVLRWPLQEQYQNITCRFREICWDGTKNAEHRGIDISAPEGTPIFATADGIVYRSETIGGYGNCIILQHSSSGLYSLYAHCSSLNASKGSSVSEGDTIAYVGSTGNSTGPHLHFELMSEYDLNPQPTVQNTLIDPTPGVNYNYYHAHPSEVILDVNGLLDGVSTDNTYLYGTFELTINGEKVTDDAVDFYETNIPYGSTYTISDIKPAEGKYFAGFAEGAYSGTLTRGMSIFLSFNTIPDSFGEPDTTATFRGHTYLFFDRLSTWYEAKAFSESMGGHLLTISDSEENAFVQDLIGAHYIWLGGTDQEQEQTWTWITGEPFSYAPWNEGEPNNDADSMMGEENHLMMIHTTGKWNDSPCCEQYSFVVEKDSITNPITFDANGGVLPAAIESHTIDAFNDARQQGFLVVYDRAGELVDTNPYGNEAVVNDEGLVVDIREFGSETKKTVPSGGYILSGHAAAPGWPNEFVRVNAVIGNYISIDKENMTAYAYDSKDAYLANTKTATTGSAFGELPTPTREGYTFMGWFTAAEGGTQVSDDTIYTDQTTLYAQWQKEHLHAWHGYVTWPLDYSTCTVDFACACGETLIETVSTTSVVTKVPTCTAAGETTYTARFTNTVIAQQTKTAEIPATGHTPGEWIIDSEAQVGVAGSKHKECPVCHTVLETEVIPALEDPTPVVDPDAPQILVESKRVNRGREFTVTVEIQNNPGFMALTLTPVFAEGLTRVKAENGTLLSEFSSGKKFIWIAGEDVSDDGVLMTLTVTTAEDLEPGEYTVDFRMWDSSNGQEETVEFSIVPGVITITDITWGDANGDDVVNNKDIVRLKNYFANLDDETGESTVEIFPGADANGDGVVNNKDIVRLKNYFANLDDDTGLSSVILGPAA